jgi:flagellar basal body-associated protein FliL
LVLTAVGAATAGTLVGPKVLASVSAPAAAAVPGASGKPHEELGEMEGESFQFEAIVVDLHDESGNTHHLKLGLAAELPAKVQRKEFERYVPRARQTAIGYLRALEFKEATSAASFPRVRDRVCAQVLAALGPTRVQRVLVTDYVVQ